MKGILNGNRIQSHRRPFCTPKPDADLCMRVSLPLDKKTVENLWTTTQQRGAGELSLTITIILSQDGLESTEIKVMFMG